MQASMKQTLQLGLMVTLVVVKRHAWLWSMALPMDTRQRIEDLPFRGSTLFFIPEKTGETLAQIKKNKQMGQSPFELHLWVPRNLSTHYPSDNTGIPIGENREQPSWDSAVSCLQTMPPNNSTGEEMVPNLGGAADPCL